MLGAAGIDVAVSAGARAGNLWPTADLLARLEQAITAGTLLLELTSSHLAFMSTSPGWPRSFSFWPDHLELHGGLEGYRAAKETIVRHQRPGDTFVFNADDASPRSRARLPARTSSRSRCARPVERGAYLEPDGASSLVDARGRRRCSVHARDGPPGNVVAAAAIAPPQGRDPQAIAWGIADAAAALPCRACPRGTLGGVPVIDDGMAATPGKTAATLARYPDRSVILVAGGMNDAGGGRVHARRKSRRSWTRACDEIARAAEVVIVFGEARPRLEALLQARRVEIVATGGLDEAVAAAHRQAAARPGAAAVVFSPVFPLPHEERARFAGLVRDTGI